MSYLHKRYGSRSGLGSLASTITTVASAVVPAIDVATDPYLPEVICRVKQLAAIDDGKPVPACASLPKGMTGGIGLRKAMVPLRAYVYAEQRPWIYPIAAALAIGVPVMLGVAIGRATRRS